MVIYIPNHTPPTDKQTTMREQAKQRMLEENSREREAFLRELYGLDAQGRLVKGQGKGEKEGGKGAGVARGKGE